MEISQTDDSCIQIAHFTLKTEQKQLKKLNPYLRSIEVQRCSWCCRYKLENHWLELDDFEVLFPNVGTCAYSNAICPSCRYILKNRDNN